jgi:hypothetical protein
MCTDFRRRARPLMPMRSYIAHSFVYARPSLTRAGNNTAAQLLSPWKTNKGADNADHFMVDGCAACRSRAARAHACDLVW